MTCLDYIEMVDSTDYWLSGLCDEMHWEGGVDTERLFEYVVDRATQEGVTLTDVDSFDYDAVLYNIYESTEKGLS